MKYFILLVISIVILITFTCYKQIIPKFYSHYIVTNCTRQNPEENTLLWLNYGRENKTVAIVNNICLNTSVIISYGSFEGIKEINGFKINFSKGIMPKSNISLSNHIFLTNTYPMVLYNVFHFFKDFFLDLYILHVKLKLSTNLPKRYTYISNDTWYKA